MTENSPRLVVVREWSGKYAINEAYRPIASGLVEKYPELRHVAVGSILFLDNTEGSGKTLDKRRFAQTGKIPEKWQQVICQLTNREFTYYMEFFKRNTAEMSREQIIALVYHELRHIGLDGELCHHEVEDWGNIIKAFGAAWATTKSKLPDLLADNIDWNSITGPSLFSEGRLKAVK